MHNTFDIKEIPEGFEARSHNFDAVGVGATEKEAFDKMNRKILYFADNYPEQYRKKILDRVKRGLYCECGVPLEEKPLGIARIE